MFTVFSFKCVTFNFKVSNRVLNFSKCFDDFWEFSIVIYNVVLMALLNIQYIYICLLIVSYFFCCCYCVFTHIKCHDIVPASSIFFFRVVCFFQYFRFCYYVIVLKMRIFLQFRCCFLCYWKYLDLFRILSYIFEIIYPLQLYITLYYYILVYVIQMYIILPGNCDMCLPIY